MKSDNLIIVIESFFNDIIGSLIPGIVFTIGLWILFPGLRELDLVFLPTYIYRVELILFIIIAYLIGHWLSSVGNSIIIIILDWFLDFKYIKYFLPHTFVSAKEFCTKIANNSDVKYVISKMPDDLIDNFDKEQSISKIHYWRSIALSLPGINRQLIYRFMFISLLNCGVATALVLIVFIWVISTLFLLFFNVQYSQIDFSLLISILVLLISIPFFERRYYFHGMSIKTPFSMAAVCLQNNVSSNASELTIYLAGGFKSGWQDVVTSSLPSMKFFDPRLHNLKDPKDYTKMDLQLIQDSKIVLAYLEKNNPGGYSLALEVGYAKALGKKIVLVDEKSQNNEQLQRYLSMIHECADHSFDTLQEAISYLIKNVKEL